MAEPTELSDATTDVIASIQDLVADQVALLVLRSSHRAVRLAVPAVLGALAVATWALAVGWLAVGTTLALATQMPAWSATLVVSVGLALLGLALASGTSWQLRQTVSRRETS